MGTDTGPADSIAIESGPPTAATLSLTEEREGEVATTGATSLGSTSDKDDNKDAHLSSIVFSSCAVLLLSP